MWVQSIATRLRAVLVHNSEFAEILRGAGLALRFRILASAVGYVSTILLARWMGPSEYGYYSFAIAWMTLLAYPATLGLPGTAVRFMAHYVAAKDWPHVVGLLRTSTWFAFGCSTLVALVSVAILLYFQAYLHPGYVIPTVVALAGIPIIAVSVVRSEGIRGLGRLALAWGPLQLGQPLLLLIVMVAMIFIAHQLSATMVVATSILASVIMLIAQWVALHTQLGAKLKVEPTINLRLWLGTALPFVWIYVANMALTQAGVIMVGIFLTARDVALYTAAATTSLLVTFLLQATNALSAPKFAAIHSQGRQIELQTLVRDVTRWTFWPSLAIALALSTLGSAVLRLFGPGFEDAHVLLVIMALGQVANAFAGPVANLLSMTGHQTLTARVLASSALLYVLLSCFVTPIWGTIGAAFVLSGVTLLWNIWLMILVARKLHINPSIFGLFRVTQPHRL